MNTTAMDPIDKTIPKAGHTHRHRDNGVGFWLSMLCLVHCLAMPVLVAAAPSFSHYVPAGEFIELGFIGLAFTLVLFQLVPAARRHGQTWVPMLAIASLAIVVVAHLLPESAWHPGISIAGSGGMAFSFLKNHRLVYHN